MKIHIHGSKLYTWCALVIAAALTLYLFKLITVFEAFFTVAVFGAVIFARHTITRKEKENHKLHKYTGM